MKRMILFSIIGLIIGLIGIYLGDITQEEWAFGFLSGLLVALCILLGRPPKEV